MKGSPFMSRSVVSWYFLISRSALIHWLDLFGLFLVLVECCFGACFLKGQLAIFFQQLVRLQVDSKVFFNAKKKQVIMICRSKVRKLDPSVHKYSGIFDFNFYFSTSMVGWFPEKNWVEMTEYWCMVLFISWFKGFFNAK